MKRLSEDDLEDALSHVTDFDDFGAHDRSQLLVSEPKLVSIQSLYKYDDIDPWVEFDKGELAEDDQALGGFRGSGWARRAREWREPEDLPPIVVYQSESYSGVADGRGRVNYAIGMGWEHIPAVFVSPKGFRPNAEYYLWVLREPQKTPDGPLDRRTAINDARMAAENGRFDTAVSIGRDPTSGAFEIIRHFEARTGERLK